MLLLIYDKEDAATAKVNVFRQIIKEEGCPIGQSGSNREGRKSERDARRHPFRLAVWPLILSKS